MRSLLHISVILISLILLACEPELAEYQEEDFASKKVEASFILIKPPDTLMVIDSIIKDTSHRYHYSLKSWVNYQLRLQVCCDESASESPRKLTPEQLAQAGFHYLWKTPQGRTSFNNNYTFQVGNSNSSERLDFWLSDTLGDSLHFEFHFDVDTSFVIDTLSQEESN